MSDKRFPGPWKISAGLAALLFTAACSGGSGSGAEEESSSEGQPATVPLAGEGFLGLACGEESIAVSRMSAEDGSVQVTHTYSAGGAVSAEEPVLGAGRPVEGLSMVTLPDCVTDVVDKNSQWDLTRNQAHELAGSVLPESSQLLVTITENRQGTEVVTIGALSSSGMVEALLPYAEVSEFSNVAHQISPQYSHSNGLIYYLELVEGTERRVVKSLDPQSGDVEEVSECHDACGRIIVDPHNSHIYSTDPATSEELPGAFHGNEPLRGFRYNSAYNRHFSNPEGTIVGFLEVSGDSLKSRRWSQGDPEVSWSAPGSGKSIPEDGWSSTYHRRSTADYQLPGQPVMMIGEYDILLDDEMFSVVSLDPEDLKIGEEPTRTLITAGDRANEHPILSADGSQVLFRSTAGSGEAAWYSVPVDGSSEPVEIGALPAEYATMVPILWN